MHGKWMKTALAVAIGTGVCAPGFAQTGPANELEALKARIAELEQRQNQDWLSERQTAEVQALIAETLQEADKNTSLLADAMVAGHDGGFFLKSSDGAFTLEFGGQLQFRFLTEIQSDAEDEADSGFQLRRTKFKIEGTVYDDWAYEIVFSADREDGSAGVEDFLIGRDIGDISVEVGKFKLPFLREELLSSSRQLAVDRSMVTEFFTLDRSEQIQLGWSADAIKIALAISDGLDEEFSDMGQDEVEIAVTGRIDIKLSGNWKQARDFVAWRSDDETGLFVGGAFHFQAGDGLNDGGASTADATYTVFTIDALFESNGLSIMAAAMFGSLEDDGGGTDRDPFGFVVQGGVMITDDLQPFVRFEFIDSDLDAAEEILAVTAGLNYFIKKHKIKVSGDVIVVFDGDLSANNIDDNTDFGNDAFSTGLGFTGNNEDASDEVIIVGRLQLQLLF